MTVSIGRGLRGVRPGGDERGVVTAQRGRRDMKHGRVFRVHEQQPVEPGDDRHRRCELRRRERRELRDTGVLQEALDAEDAGREQLRQVGEIGRHRTAPEAGVDPAVPAGGGLLGGQRRRGQRRWQRVQRHVDQRGDAGRGRRHGRGVETLPLGAAGFVDVHVGVDDARDEHLVVGQRPLLLRGDRSAEVLDTDDAAEPHREGDAALGAVDDRPPGVDDEFGDRAGHQYAVRSTLASHAVKTSRAPSASTWTNGIVRSPSAPASSL